MVSPAAETGDPFLGRWIGHYQGEGADRGPFQAHVIPQGGHAYDVWVRMGERGSRYRIDGERQGEVLRFRGRFQYVSGTDDASYELSGEIRGGHLTGRYDSAEGSGTLELTKEPSVPLAAGAPPPGATLLFAGDGLPHWRTPASWPRQADGSLVSRGQDLVTRGAYDGFTLHLEFLLPLLPEARGEARAASGVVLGDATEVRILDSFGGEPTKHSGGAIVGVAAPRLEATRPPLQWQVMEITVNPLGTLRAGDADRRAEITVVLNSEVLHDRRLLDHYRAAPLRLRSTGSAVRFRNLWILPQRGGTTP